MDKMLIDDIVDHDVIKMEHQKFVSFLRTQNITVIEQEELLKSILLDGGLRDGFLNYYFNRDIADKLASSSVIDIINYIYNGVPPRYSNVKRIIPIVNSMFTRDSGVMLGGYYLPGRATYEVRKREFSLIESIFRFHKDYSTVEHLDYNSNGTIDGGDVQVISEDVVLIGVSERTSIDTIEILKNLIFAIWFKYIVAVNLPKRRSAMHLDTVFTMVNTKECVVYPPLILGSDIDKSSSVIILSKNGREEIGDLISALSYVGLCDMTPILCGGNDILDQEREQWTDGANCISIAPGHAIIYNRNKRTIEEFKKNWYLYIQAEKVYAPLPLKHKFIIGIDGFELSRTRVGSHCLTFPLFRS